MCSSFAIKVGYHKDGDSGSDHAELLNGSSESNGRRHRDYVRVLPICGQVAGVLT